MQAVAELSTPPLSGKRNPPLRNGNKGKKKTLWAIIIIYCLFVYRQPFSQLRGPMLAHNIKNRIRTMYWLLRNYIFDFLFFFFKACIFLLWIYLFLTTMDTRNASQMDPIILIMKMLKLTKDCSTVWANNFTHWINCFRKCKLKQSCWRRKRWDWQTPPLVQVRPSVLWELLPVYSNVLIIEQQEQSICGNGCLSVPSQLPTSHFYIMS